jgi:hypothetical protein
MSPSNDEMLKIPRSLMKHLTDMLCYAA